MRLRELERELAAAGFTYVRNSARGHPIYIDEHGHTLTVSAHGGRTKVFCRSELTVIRRTVERLLTTQTTGGNDAC
jgi:predicted RNA binding protein YcfA (HicA-like mRNA interferase family)